MLSPYLIKLDTSEMTDHSINAKAKLFGGITLLAVRQF